MNPELCLTITVALLNRSFREVEGSVVVDLNESNAFYNILDYTFFL